MDPHCHMYNNRSKSQITEYPRNSSFGPYSYKKLKSSLLWEARPTGLLFVTSDVKIIIFIITAATAAVNSSLHLSSSVPSFTQQSNHNMCAGANENFTVTVMALRYYCQILNVTLVICRRVLFRSRPSRENRAV